MLTLKKQIQEVSREPPITLYTILAYSQLYKDKVKFDLHFLVKMNIIVFKLVPIAAMVTYESNKYKHQLE
jgi:hypothetical protein